MEPRHRSAVMKRVLTIFLAVSVLPVGSKPAAAQLRYNVAYKCGGEHIEVAYCRADSDMPGFPRTTPQNDYCLVYYPDRPKRGGFTVQTSELRGDVIKKLQACGALPGAA